MMSIMNLRLFEAGSFTILMNKGYKVRGVWYKAEDKKMRG
jgi:hypothetical protein